MLSRNQPTALCFHLFAMIQTCTYLQYIQVRTLHKEGKQEIYRQIFNRKWTSRKITHPQSLFT